MASLEHSHELGIPPNVWRVTHDTADLTRTPPRIREVNFWTDTKRIALDLNKTACIVIDMQNDFCHSDGWLSSVVGIDVTPLQSPVANLQQLLPVLRRQSIPVVWVNWGLRPDLRNIGPALQHVYKPSGTGCGLGDSLPTNGAPVLTKGSWAAAIVDDLPQDRTQDVYVDKCRMSGFWDTPLDSILRNLNKTTLIFAGVNADQCVMCTLQDANFLGYDCVLLRDCTATSSPDYCMQATIYNVNQCFGFTTDSEKILKSISESEFLSGRVHENVEEHGKDAK